MKIEMKNILKKSGVLMTPAQKEIYHVIEEFWLKFGFGPSIDDVMYITGSVGRGNTSRKMWHLVKIGLCRGTKNKARSIRPTSLRVRNLE